MAFYKKVNSIEEQYSYMSKKIEAHEENYKYYYYFEDYIPSVKFSFAYTLKLKSLLLCPHIAYSVPISLYKYSEYNTSFSGFSTFPFYNNYLFGLTIKLSKNSK